MKGITVEIGGDTTKLGNALKNVNNAIKKTQSELKGVNTLLKLDPTNITLITQKQKLLSAAVVDTKDKLDALKETQRLIDSGDIEATEEQYRDLQREIASTEAKLKKLSAEHREFASASAVQLQAVGNQFRQIGERMTAAGEALLPLTAAIGAVGIASTAVSVQFESSFAGVKKTVDATTEELEELAEASRQAALAKPVDVNDINYIMELGGQLGIATDQLSKFASVVGDLSVSTNLGVEDASMQLSQFMNICGTATEDIDRLGAALVGLGNNSATTESDIMEMAMRIAGSGSQIGMTESQILGFSASLASVGINAEAGGTAISTIMSQIDKDVAKNGENLEAWASAAGMSAKEFAVAWEEDAAGAIVTLIGGMQKAVESGSNINLILDELGVDAIRQTDTLKRLTNASDLMASTIDVANVSWAENVALTNEATQRYQTTESRLLMLKNQVVDIGISIGNGLKNALVALMDVLQPVMDGIQRAARAFEEASPAVQTLIVGAMGLVAGLGPVLIIAGKVTSGVGSLMVALGKSAAAFSAKAAAASGDTAATVANSAATNANVIATNAQIVKNAIKEATDTRLAAKTAAKTATTTADTVATTVNTAATGSNATAATAASIKVAALTVAMKAKAAATAVATTAQLLWNAAMTANPFGVVLVAIGALVTVIGAFAVAVANATGSQEKLTKATQEQQGKVEELQASYDAVVAAQGEHSDAAVKAKAALEEEQAALDASKETMAEFIARCEDTVAAHEELAQSTTDATRAADSQAGMVLNLADRIGELAAVESKTAEQKAQLAALTASLTQSCESLTVSYDSQNDVLSMNIEALQAAAQAEADRLRSDAAMKNYQSLLEDEAAIMADLAAAQSELDAETQASIETWGKLGDTQVYTSQTQLDLENTVDSLTRSLEENRNQQKAALEISAKYATRQSVLALALEEVESGALSAEEAAAKYTDTVEGGITADEILAEQAHQAAIAQAELAAALNEAEAAVMAYAQTHPSFQAALDAAGVTVQEFSEMIATHGIKFEDAKKEMEEYVSKAASAFQKIADSSSNSLEALKETLAYNLEATQNWEANLKAVFGRTGVSFSQEFVNAVRSGGVGEYGAVMAELATLTDAELQAISDSFAANGQAGVEAYLAEQKLLIPGTKEALEGADKAVDEALGAGADAAGTAGAKTGREYTASLANALSRSPEEVKAYVAQLESELEAGQANAAKSGSATGSSYTDSLAAAIASSSAEVQTYIAQLEAELASLQGRAGAMGTSTGAAYGGNTAMGMRGQAGNVAASASLLSTSVQDELNKLPDGAGATGAKVGDSFAGGILGAVGSAAASAFALKTSAENQLSSTNANVYGLGVGNAFASGIGGAYGAVSASAQTIASCCRQWASMGGEAKVWGWDAGSQFANGLRSARSLVSSAATAIASAARAILHFSVPDEGPLADADEYGPDFGMLIADGLRSKVSEVRAAATEIAQAARDEMNDAFSQRFNLSSSLEMSTSSIALSGKHGVFSNPSNLFPDLLLPLANDQVISRAAQARFGRNMRSNQASVTTNNFYGNITLSANDVRDIQTFDDFAARLQREMRVL